MTKSNAIHISKTVIIYKFVTGVIELILGLGILFFGRNIARIYVQYEIREFLEDPHDILIAVTDKVVAPLVIHHRVYLMFFLIVLGITKIIAAIGLLYKKEWGLDLLIGLFIILLPFDIFTLFSHPTFLKAIYFLLNVFIALYLIEFKPHTYFLRYIKFFKKRKRNS